MILTLLKEVNKMMSPHIVYAVGGCVRDYVRGDDPKDFDFCTSANPDVIELSVKASGRRAYLIGKKFGTIGCKIDGQMVEITTFRTEKYTPGNRKPEVEYVKSINEDLSRRDFTINAMCMRMNKKGEIKIIDPYKGQEDLSLGIIRAVGFPKQRFKEDPLRMLRAVRFASRYNFGIEDKTYEKMQKMAIGILDISKERWMMEMDKILMTDNVERGLTYLWDCNLFRYMIPELHLQDGYKQNSKYHNFDLNEHTAKVVACCPKDINLRWAALLHDIAKPFTRTDKIREGKLKSNYIGHAILGADMVLRIAGHLKWSNERTKSVVNIVRTHLEDDCVLRQYDNESKGVKNER